ncbi:MAG: amino acid--[acyl-carrier-protein] ligase [Gemmatimonadaceae bacterium]
MPTSTPPASDPLASVAESLFVSLGSDGVYARSGLYEEILERLAVFITKQRDPDVEVFRFPPVVNRTLVEKSGYLKSFPNLLGCVSALHGTEAAIRGAADGHEMGRDWTESVSASDLVLIPAACYPIYPMVAARGEPVPAGGLQFDVAADCFRHEPSKSLDRLQSFRMREYVLIGTPSEITAYRDRWMKRAEAMAAELGLPCQTVAASDPFFGRVGQVIAVSQKQQSLKFELTVPYYPGAKPTACMSFNYHRDHFGDVWAIKDATGEPVHTGCVAFGMDRLTVALFCVHGLNVARWPGSVRRALGL